MHGGPAWALDLPDGRWLVVDLGHRGARRPLLNIALFLGSVALGVGLGAYPFVRRLTRRLERLQKGVERIGSGDLAARIEVEGRDEVAALAASFNEAAGKIEKLLGAHRLLLANASHELRTPLSRIRLGVEMLKNGGDPARKAMLESDIAELDSLIDEILLMSQLDAGSHADLSQKVDLVALAAEECARYQNCTLSGSAPEIPGDPRLLRRLVRNLLENAHRHAAPPVEVEIVDTSDVVTLTVSDGGDGISEAERDRVFQPFYRVPGTQNMQGYGLGLPLVRQIAEAHGGSVAILPPVAGRSSISVTLPIRRAE
jgi:signal transduction histidine kinase